MRLTKNLSLVALVSVLFCSTLSHGQERLWGSSSGGAMFSVNKDGSDFQATGQFSSDRYGVVRGFTPLPNGEIFLSTEYDAGDYFGRLGKISATGLDTIYQLGYAQYSGTYGMTVGENGKVYIPFSGAATIKLVGVLLADPTTLTVTQYNLHTQPFSADYFLTSTPQGIYGVSRGNINYKGGVFRLDPNNPKSYQFVYQFTGGADGSAPKGPLTVGQDGYLFGRTQRGGLNNDGIYFKVKPDGTSFTKLFDIATGAIGEKDGSGKFQRLLELIGQGYIPATDSDGNIFHHASDGIYQVGLDGYPILKVTDQVVDRIYFVEPSFNHIVTINNIADGAINQPTTLALTVNAFKGAKRYDLQVSTSADFSNVVQELSSNTTSFVVNDLDPSTTYYVRARPNIYPYWGQPIHFSTGTSSVITNARLWSFMNGPNGSSILNGDLHTFASTYFSNEDGANHILGMIPLDNGEKIIISDGGLFSEAYGEIWKVTSTGVVKLYDIWDYPDYSRIVGSAIDGGDGYVYALNFGVASSIFTGIIRFKTDGTSYEHHSFRQAGLFEGAQIMKASDGIYGTAQGQHANLGLLFKLRADLSGVDIIHHFTVDSLGSRPQAELTEGRDGYLYGTARAGGRHLAGVIFKISKTGANYTVLHHFRPDAGKNPDSKMVQDNDGWLYGTTRFGGNGPAGVVYKIYEDGTGFQKLFNYQNIGGRTAPILALDDQYLYVAGPLRKYSKDGTFIATLGNFGDVWRASSVACDTYVTNIADGDTGVPPHVTAIAKEMTGAAKYFIEVSTSADFSSYERMVANDVNFSLELEDNTTYYTRVFSSLLPDAGPTISFTTGTVSDARVAVRHEETSQSPSASGKLAAYPNPSRDGFNLSADPAEVKSIVMTEANGNVVYRFENDGGQLPAQFGSGLARGVYFLRVQTTRGTETLRVVRQ